jgi:uncharacterized protein YkwD
MNIEALSLKVAIPALRNFLACILMVLAITACTPLTAAGPLWTNTDLDQRLLAAHNSERARIGVPPLRWNSALAEHAAHYADTLTHLPRLRHDPSIDEEGENLWRGTKAAYTPEAMVGLWIDERRAFKNAPIPNASITGEFEDVGHYTQVIWRTTTQVGCAVRATRYDEILVCRYMEGGNVIGERAL